METDAPRSPSLRQILLGLFICWQLGFLFLANYLQLLYLDTLQPAEEVRAEQADQSAPERTVTYTEASGKAVLALCKRYGQLTGQVEEWWLFALFPHHSTFPQLELRWPDQPAVQLPGLFEPADPAAYFHPPGGSDRLYHFEANISLRYHPWDEARRQKEPQRYQRIYLARARTAQQPVLAYMRWQLKQFQQTHPESPPPTELILSSSTHATPPPGQWPWEWPAPVVKPLFRWRPEVILAPGQLPVEAYDPVAGGFVRLQDGDTP